MKVLAIAPWVPSKRRPRSLGLLQGLSDRHTVKLIAATWDAEDEQDLADLPYESRGVPFSLWAGRGRAVAAVASRRSLQQAFLTSRAMRDSIAEEMKTFRPDAVYFNTLRSAQWEPLASGTTTIIDLDEFRSHFYRLAATEHTNPISRLVARIEAKRMARAEKSIVQTFDRVLVSSPLDLDDAISSLHLVRSPHALASRESETSRNTRPTMVFVGRMSYSANCEAIVWFAHNVLPGVVANVPDVLLRVVGDAPTREVLALNGPNVEVLGRVESVDEFYAQSDVSIVPVTMATGVQMKLIESLYSGVAVVCTSLVARQAGVRDQHEVLIADTVGDWVQKVSMLLNHPERARTLGDVGRRWAHDNYSTERILETLHSALDD